MSVSLFVFFIVQVRSQETSDTAIPTQTSTSTEVIEIAGKRVPDTVSVTVSVSDTVSTVSIHRLAELRSMETVLNDISDALKTLK